MGVYFFAENPVMTLPIPFQQVRKRDGQIVPFDLSRITSAIARAMQASGEGDTQNDAARVSDQVVTSLGRKYPAAHIPTIEQIQDVVEEQLILMDFSKTAKAYILYRNDRTRVRELRRTVPERVQRLCEKSKKYFRNPLAEFVYYRSYSRWMEEEGRRETWVETVDRYMNFMKENVEGRLSKDEYEELRQAILHQEVMPSMRLMWSAGAAARATPVSAFNCSYTAPRNAEDLAEIMYICMCGTGVGFSVESQTAQQFPLIKKRSGENPPVHVIEDSKEGWARAFTLGLRRWFEGADVAFDYSRLRPAGTPLRTMGGRSSGPEPLRRLMDFARQKILSRQGKRLANIDIHDIICKIGEIVVAGGVRRSALISLSDLDDPEMRAAKTGAFYAREPQRAMANNSAVYNQRPSAVEFLEEWLALAKSGTGERGIFNRGSLLGQIPERRRKIFEPAWATCGTNPCGEIVLKSKEFCNLTEVVARPDDTEEALHRKVRLATIVGTYQSMLTEFPFLSSEWRKNCEEERLLGVSITGQWDCPAVRNPGTLMSLRGTAVRTNEAYARKLGVSISLAVTCVKPSGTVSQLTDASSGLHLRHAHYYIRRVRINAADPLFQMLKDQKVPYYPEVGQTMSSANVFVFEFPVAAPPGSVTRNDLSALDQLEYWKMIKQYYTEHNPSVTISVAENEWLEVAHWLYRNWDILGGLSFLPRADHVYLLAPYEEISASHYEEMVSKFPPTDFSQITIYEKEDQTQGAKELACANGVCEGSDPGETSD
jgi:ribonucleoside-triphosphate reductase